MTAPASGTLEREVAKIVADVLLAELALDEAHCLLGNQAWDIPPDRQLFVVVFDQAAPPIGGVTYLETDETSPNFGKEIQQSTVIHDVRVELMSFGPEARLRKEEIGLALNSFLAQQAAARYGVQIGRAQTPVDASETEVTMRLQRFVVHVNVTALHQKVKEPPRADYFDKFNIRPGFDAAVNPPQVAEQG
ncbi:MAG: hypothetical protein V4510_10075 [bacterium]